MKINNNLKEIIKTASNNTEIIQILALQDIFKRLNMFVCQMNLLIKKEVPLRRY